MRRFTAAIIFASLALVACDRRQQTRPVANPVEASSPLPWKQVGDHLRAALLPDRPATGGTRFVSLPPGETGLDFAHKWTPPPGYQLELYNSLPGGGVCVGDYDGDDLPDVFLTQPDVGAMRYRNLGGFRFEQATAAAGISAGMRALGVTFIDVDNDGDLDLHICRKGEPNQLYINQGKGTFREEAAARGLAFKGASVMAAFADYDRDGDLDAFLVTYRMEPETPVPNPTANPDGSYTIPDEHREFVDVIVDASGRSRIIKAAQRDHLYQNNGDGTFTDVTLKSGIGGNYWGLSATWWDYDRDGYLDLYISNDFYSPDQLYKNKGDGTFTDVTREALPHTPWYSMGTDIADINNDGWMDFMGSDMSGSNHYKQKASMGDMATTGWFLTHAEPRQYMRNALYLNTGTPRFMEIANLAGVANTDWTWSLKFADLDEDSWIDLFVTNGMNRDWTNSDIRNRSDKAATAEEKMRIWVDSPQRRDPDLVFRNTGDLRFTNQGTEWGLGAETVSYGAAFADLDRDGDLDLVVNNAEQAASLYQNRSHGSNRFLLRLEGNPGFGTTVTITTASGNQMRTLTSGQGYMAANEPLFHFGTGQDAMIQRLEIQWPGGHSQIFHDLPTNHFYAVTESTGEATKRPETHALFMALPVPSMANHKETPFNDYLRQPLLPHQHSQLGPGVAWADVDGDGRPDFFMGGASGQSGQLLLNKGNMNFVPAERQPWQANAESEDMGVLFFDADADNDADLFVVSGGVECAPGDAVLRDRLYLNDGSGRFTTADASALPDLRDSGSTANAADFDHDGDLDLFVGSRIVPGEFPISPQSRLLRNDGGRFTDVTAEIAPGFLQAGLVTSALWSDSNNDGWSDLLVTTELGPTRLFRNQSGKFSEHTGTAGFSSQSGWFNSIAGADFDSDGDTDYAVGNLGRNTKYHASPAKPYFIYYGDFDNTGRNQLVEAEFENDVLFPVRGRSCSSAAMPHLAAKFPTFHAFASASLGEIYTDQHLAAAKPFTVNSLDSGVWRNQGDGTFIFLPLPTLAQASPTFGMVVLHANNDRHPDLFIAQNFYGLQPETGHADGGVGLLLLGKGDATFTPVPPAESGLVVPGQATSATYADVTGDGQFELIVASNNGPLHFFQPRSPLKTHSLHRLEGIRGNPDAVGARLIAAFEDGTRQSIEFHAGSGYLSQSQSLAMVPQAAKLEIVWPDGVTVPATVFPVGTEPALSPRVISHRRE